MIRERSGWPAARWRFTAMLVVLLQAAGVVRAAEEREPDPPGTLCVMTYNLRYASETPPNAWRARLPVMRDLIQSLAPDVMGTQEGLHQQLRELAAQLPAYDWIGTGRDGGNDGEFMAVFYLKTRLEPLATNHFWLSDTPEVPGSATWGNKNRRLVTWVRFLDRETKKEFYLFNTHFDHEVQAAREKSAELVRRRVGSLTNGLPVVLTGDFNAAAGNNPAYDSLLKDDFFRDTWRLAKRRSGEEYGTFNGFRAAPRDGVRIDWILIRGEAQVDFAAVIPFAREGRFPSDHFPVVTKIRLVN